MPVDCNSCGRTGLDFDASVDLCNRVHCPAFNHFMRLKETVSAQHQRRKRHQRHLAIHIVVGLAACVLAWLGEPYYATGGFIGFLIGWNWPSD